MQAGRSEKENAASSKLVEVEVSLWFVGKLSPITPILSSSFGESNA
jgi:hypothetical protein